jgi:valyl-tRNA synthetase
MSFYGIDLTKEMSAGYDPKEVEAKWSDWWEAKGFFTPDCSEDEPEKEKFVMVIPPPNVTGALHLGHTLTNAIEDCLCRWYDLFC